MVTSSNPNIELVALLESYEIKHHYPDFLRIYNSTGLSKIIKYYKMNMSKITDFYSVIIHYEVESSHIFDSVKVLYTNPNNFYGNIHFDDEYLKEYLCDKNYPVIKIKKIMSDNNEYKIIHSNIISTSDNNAATYFKKNQQFNMPLFLERYLISIGFKIA